MLKNIIIIILSIVPLVCHAEADTLRIVSAEADFAPRNVFFEMELNRSGGKLQNATLKITTKDDSLGIELVNSIMANDTIFAIKDSSLNALSRIYSLLGCKESDLKEKYYRANSRYGTVVVNHLINHIFQLPEHQLTIVIVPQLPPVAVTPIFRGEILWLIIGILSIGVLVLIILYFNAMGKSKKPISTVKEIRDSIKLMQDELNAQQQKDLTEVEVINILTQKYYELIKLDKENKKLEELKGGLENTILEYQKYIAQASTGNEADKQYFRQISDTYIVPFVQYFKNDTQYPADAETQAKLISNLIPLAFHFMSFVKVKNEEGSDYDKLNIQQLLNPAFFSERLKKVDFSANLTDTDNKLVLHIIELLKQYHVSELEKVNINGYIIKNDKSNV